MPDTIPSRVFPLPGWSGTITSHYGVPSALGGSDLMVAPGSVQPVVSITNGTVVQVYKASQHTAGGNAIEIKGADGLYYYYAHMRDPPTVSSGDTIRVGEEIGIADSSGNASPDAPHLHIGIGHSIQGGTGTFGGLGVGFNAVGLLQDLQVRANIPALATDAGQAQVRANQPAGTIQLDTPTAPAPTDPIIAKIQYLARLLLNAGVDPSVIPRLVAISLAENGSSNPNAISSTHDYGLWQINWPVWGGPLCENLQICSFSALMDPANNARAAKYVYDHQGLRAWVTHQQGLDQRWIAQVDQALSGVDLSTPGGIATGAGASTDCGEWVLADFDILNQHVHLTMPDLGCVLLQTLSEFIDNLVKSFSDAFTQWLYDWSFSLLIGGLGVIFILIAAGIIAGQNPQTLIAAAS